MTDSEWPQVGDTVAVCKWGNLSDKVRLAKVDKVTKLHITVGCYRFNRKTLRLTTNRGLTLTVLNRLDDPRVRNAIAHKMFISLEPKIVELLRGVSADINMMIEHLDKVSELIKEARDSIIEKVK